MDSCIMCMPMKEQKVKGVVLEELRLLQRLIKKLKMSIVSDCLKCIRMGRGNRMDLPCLDLAIQAEQAFRLGDFDTCLSIFESALQVGTDDVKLLTSIYTQMGYAYSYLGDYAKALEYYEYDLKLTRTIGDVYGEARACGNLASTLKVLGRCDEAIYFCKRHLDTMIAMCDKVGQCKALYIFGNVYHAKAIEMSWSGVEPGHFADEAKAALRKAVQYYESNLSLVKETGDRAAEGRAYGKLGHTYHLLGDFESAIAAHEKRLLIAYEFEDESAERRAHCNLGSTHTYLGQYVPAVYHYLKTLNLTRQLKEREMEAQVCYSLGKVYALLENFERAIDYYHKHLVIAQELNDRVGEGRVYWTLANTYTALGNHEQAINFTQKHLEIAIETGDTNGAALARMNLLDLQQVSELKSKSDIHDNTDCEPDSLDSGDPEKSVMDSPSATEGNVDNQEECQSPEKTQSKESPSHTTGDTNGAALARMNLSDLQQVSELKSKSDIHDSTDCEPDSLDSGDPEKSVMESPSATEGNVDNQEECQSPEKMRSKESPSHTPGSQDAMDDESFLDLLSHFQGHRMDDQRCTLDGQIHSLSPNIPPFSPPVTKRESSMKPSKPLQGRGHFLEQLANSQARHLNDQQASLTRFPGLHLSTSSLLALSTSSSDTLSPASTDACQTLGIHRKASFELSEEHNVFFDILEKNMGFSMNDQRYAAPPRKSVTIPFEDLLKDSPPSPGTHSEPEDKHGV